MCNLLVVVSDDPFLLPSAAVLAEFRCPFWPLQCACLCGVCLMDTINMGINFGEHFWRAFCSLHNVGTSSPLHCCIQCVWSCCWRMETSRVTLVVLLAYAKANQTPELCVGVTYFVSLGPLASSCCYSGTSKCGHFWDQAKMFSLKGCPLFRGLLLIMCFHWIMERMQWVFFLTTLMHLWTLYLPFVWNWGLPTANRICSREGICTSNLLEWLVYKWLSTLLRWKLYCVMLMGMQQSVLIPD